RRSLGTASGFLFALALVPGLPFLPFAALALATGAAFASARARDSAAARLDAPPSPTKLTPTFAPRLALHLGSDLDARLHGEDAGAGSRRALAEAIRRRLLARHGFEIDEIEVSVGGSLHPAEAVASVRG